MVGVLARSLASLMWAAVLLVATSRLADAHVTVVPAESTAGATERYSIRVPGEKTVETTRIELQMPEGLRVTELQLVPGWRIMAQTDGSGRVVSAVWEGGNVPLGQFVELGLMARNPDSPTELRWALIQTYQDGSEVQWIGPASAQFPAVLTRVRSAGPTIDIGVLGTSLALLISLVAACLALGAWRKVAALTPTGPDK